MDKRWRNLGILVLIVAIILFVYFFVLPNDSAKIASIAQSEGTDVATLSGFISSPFTILPDSAEKKILDACPSVSKENCAVLQKVVLLNNAKKELYSDTNTMLSKSTVRDFCVGISEGQEKLWTDFLKVEYAFYDLPEGKNSLGLDLNSAKFQLQKEAFETSISNYIVYCTNTISDIETHLTEEDLINVEKEMMEKVLNE